MKTLYMETTAISPEKTAGEITSELIRAGANQISTEYADGRIKALRWTMKVSGNDVLFEMPVRVEPVFQILKKRSPHSWISGKRAVEMWAKAERVAWRQLLRWVQSQMAMVETGMVQPAEVFLAYTWDHRTNQTLFQRMMETQFKALPAPEKQ